MSDKVYLTKGGLEKLKAELHTMKKDDRKRLADAIQEAREKGDLKENAEYKAAKEEQSILETKIQKLENDLANAVLIDESNMDTSKAFILTHVRVKNLKTKKELKYQLVSEKEQDLKAKKISVSSPVGKGLLGGKVGDIVDVKVPAGTMQFEILEITLD